MKALVVKGQDKHYQGRLITGLLSCELEVSIATQREQLDGSFYDLIFVDHSCQFDPSGKLNGKYIFFFDTEDDPKHFTPDIAYYSLKDSIKYYAKMNFIEQNDRKDNIKNIGFPLPVFLPFKQLANYSSSLTPSFVPYLVAAPTYIGKYVKEKEGQFSEGLGVRSLGVHESGDLLYNQRIDWLLSLKMNQLPYVGGIVFKEENLSKEWQSKYFGNVGIFAHLPIDFITHVNCLFQFGIGLCPTGHERLSWRTYDIMASGAILVRTDHKNQKALINPSEYITVKDGESLFQVLNGLQNNYNSIWKMHQKNREVFKSLTPERLINLFLEQLD